MATTAPDVRNLPVDQIDPSPDNPRTALGGDLGDLTELTESIRAQGVLQRLIVCPEVDGRHQLVFGHRRLEAAKLAGRAEVPVEIRDYDVAARLAAMCGENEGREDLTPLQEAFAYKQALDRKGPDNKKLFTQRTLAERLGVSQAKISKYTGIFKLPEHVITMLKAGELSVTEAIHLLPLTKEPARIEAALEAFREHGGDMELAVRTQQADMEREATVAKTRKQLERDKVRIAPDTWRDDGARLLGDGYHQVPIAPQEHAGEPCHAATVNHHGDVVWVCTEPERHEEKDPPAEAQPPAARPAANRAEPSETTVTVADQPPADADASTEVAPGEPAGEQTSDAAPVLAVAPEPSEEELEARRRLDEAREAAEAERQELARKAQERAEQLDAAYQGRVAALRTLLGGRLSRPAAGRLIAEFLLELAFVEIFRDVSFLEHTLALDEDDGGGQDAVRAFAGKNEDALLRAAVAIIAENAEEQLGAGDQPNFASPFVPLYLNFLTKHAAYKLSDIERAELQQATGGDAAEGQEADGTADSAEPEEAEEGAGSEEEAVGVA